MDQGVQIEFGSVSGETLFLAMALFFLSFLICIRLMMKFSLREQIKNFDDFKQAVSKNLGEISGDLKKLHEQFESANRAKERRIENIEHNMVSREEFYKENTLLKSANDDSLRHIQYVQAQLENLKLLITGKLNESKSN